MAMLTDLSPHDRVTRQRAVIMRDKRFVPLVGVMMTGTWRVTKEEGIKTAATNGLEIIYNPDFVMSISDAVLRFTVLHEVMHGVLMHLVRFKAMWKEDPRTANLAMDAVINLMLDKMAGAKSDRFIEVWEHAVLDYQYDGMDTVEVYRLMRKQQQENPQQKKPSSASGGTPQEFDQHTPAQEAPTGVSDEPAEPRAGPKPLTQAQADAVATQTDTALRQGAQMAGKMGGTMDRSISNLLTPAVDWAEPFCDYLREHTEGNDQSTWRRPSRRSLITGIPMPSRFSEGAKHIVLGIDTSGSIDEKQLRRVLSEVAAICEVTKVDRVDIIYWDARVAAHETYEGEQVPTLTESTKPQGGGGTDVRRFFNYLDAKEIKPDCIAVFTDGYTPWPTGYDAAPVLWCISTKIKAPWGPTIHVPAT